MTTPSHVSIGAPQGPMPAYCAVPTTRAPWPGVVVVHDFSGTSNDLRHQADWLAGEGFLAIAPDLYHRGNRLTCLRTVMRDIGRRSGRTFDDIDAARGWLADQRRVHGPHRGDRLLHGRWLRAGAGAEQGFLGLERQLRGLPVGRRLVARRGLPRRRELRRRRRLAPGCACRAAAGAGARRARRPPRREDLSRSGDTGS